MKIILLILLASCTLINADYPRHKVRGPPYPSRIPPSKQFSKKWYQQIQHPPRKSPIRSRPIPVHMPSSHKLPMGAPPAPPRTVALPVRTYWKNTQTNNIKIPQEKPYIPQEKPFLAAPNINLQEIDYHIQTNNIPTTHNNPIKQVGEKGPIHTIPAPNLSLRDKPIVVEEIKHQFKNPYKHFSLEESHQYQVTEQPEHTLKSQLYKQQQEQQERQQQQHKIIQQQLRLPQQLYQQQHQIQQQLQQHPEFQLQHEQYLQQEHQKQVEVQPQKLFYATDGMTLAETFTQKTPQGDIYLSSHLNPKELYQLIGAAYPQQPQIQYLDTQQKLYQPQKTQQVPNYQALLSEQLFQPDQQAFRQNLQLEDNTKIASDKVSFEPEFQSFNYDEQAHQKSQKGLSKDQISSLVTAAYALNGNVPPAESRNSLDPLAQAQLIQSYFDTRTNAQENDVEPDAKPSVDQKSEPEKIKEELLSSSYFSSLPNKEAADRLAQLQAAGKINSNLMKISSDNTQSNERPNEEQFEEDRRQDNSNEEINGNYSGNIKEQANEYDDYSQEDENISSEETDKEFGDKLVSSRQN